MSTPVKITVSDLVRQKYMRKVVLIIAPFVSFAFAIYLGVVTITKTVDLREKETIMARTIETGMRAGDWELALDYLKASVKSGGISEVELNEVKSHQQISGPFRSKQFAFLPICDAQNLPGGLELNACVGLITPTEAGTLAIIIVLISLLIFMSARFFNNILQDWVHSLTSQIVNMRDIVNGTGSPDPNIASSFNTVEFTDLIEQIKQLVVAAKKQQADRIRADLVAQIVHDIRNPVSALKIACSPGKISCIPDVRSLITSSISRIEQMCLELLETYRKPTSAKVSEFAHEKSGILKAVRTYVENKQREFDSNKENVRIAISADSKNGRLSISENEMLRLIDNLVTNAVRALQNGEGHILIEIKSAQSFMVVKVTDNGRGIEESLIDKIFDKQTRGRESEGYGLGLHYVKSTITTHGGAVNVRSKPFVGTIFEFSLPILDSERDISNEI